MASEIFNIYHVTISELAVFRDFVMVDFLCFLLMLHLAAQVRFDKILDDGRRVAVQEQFRWSNAESTDTTSGSLTTVFVLSRSARYA